jgi:hypothetical protein
MRNGKIAFVVGHSNWGKSKTLTALTNGNHHLRKTTIAGDEFFIRRMSNDDQTEGYIKFMMSLDPAIRPYLIAALCPQFDDLTIGTHAILSTLHGNGYGLFFWVIEHQYKTDRVVTAKEITLLRGFGTVEVFTKKAEASVRSKGFKEFVKNVVCA